MAAAGGAMVAFAVSAGVDWAWEMTVLPVAFLALLACAAGPAAESGSNREVSRFEKVPWAWTSRIAFGLAGIIALVAVFIPYEGDRLVRESQASYRGGDRSKALDQANSALDIQPYSASANVQKAQLLAVQGQYSASVEAARQATRDEPGNWKNWFVLSQVLDSAGESSRAGLALSRAFNLNSGSLALQELNRTYGRTK